MSTARRVFISHSHQDNELVRDIARRLRDAGFETSVDFEPIASGAEFRKQVHERLSQSSVLLILVTFASLQTYHTVPFDHLDGAIDELSEKLSSCPED